LLVLIFPKESVTVKLGKAGIAVLGKTRCPLPASASNTQTIAGLGALAVNMRHISHATRKERKFVKACSKSFQNCTLTT